MGVLGWGGLGGFCMVIALFFKQVNATTCVQTRCVSPSHQCATEWWTARTAVMRSTAPGHVRASASSICLCSQFTHPSICPSIYLSIHLSVHLSICTSIYLYIHITLQAIFSFIHPSIHLSIYTSILVSIHQCIYPSIHSSKPNPISLCLCSP